MSLIDTSHGLVHIRRTTTPDDNAAFTATFHLRSSVLVGNQRDTPAEALIGLVHAIDRLRSEILNLASDAQREEMRTNAMDGDRQVHEEMAARQKGGGQ